MSRLINQRSPDFDACDLSTPPLSEEASHREHDDALDATIFQRSSTRKELVFELDHGQLRLCGRNG
jgi:hypothetical protein